MNNNDTAAMTFLRALRQHDSYMTLHTAFSLVEAAEAAYGVDPRPGTVVNGVYFSPEADELLRTNKKIQAIKEVRNDNRKDDGSIFGLKEAKDACDDRARLMSWPTPAYRNY